MFTEYTDTVSLKWKTHYAVPSVVNSLFSSSPVFIVSLFFHVALLLLTVYSMISLLSLFFLCKVMKRRQICSACCFCQCFVTSFISWCRKVFLWHFVVFWLFRIIFELDKITFGFIHMTFSFSHPSEASASASVVSGFSLSVFYWSQIFDLSSFTEHSLLWQLLQENPTKCRNWTTGG